MKTVKIRTIQQLIAELNGLPNHYIYRGQADSDWRLESCLERLLGQHWSAEAAKRWEEFSLSRFKAKFHLYDRENLAPESKLAWLAIMQHHGVPTRLLDFTESAYVATYFAIEAYHWSTQKDMAIFAIDYSDLMENSLGFIRKRDVNFDETRNSIFPKQDRVFDQIIDERSYDVAWVAEPLKFNSRLDRQSGTFLIAGNRGVRIEEILKSRLYSKTAMVKYQIPGRFYQSLFALLRKMNITSKSLYGDLDGLASSIGLEMKVYSAQSQNS